MGEEIGRRLRDAFRPVMTAEPDRRAIGGLFLKPGMWDLLRGTDGRVIAARPRRAAPGREEGITLGWHRDGDWTDDPHLTMTWDQFAQEVFLPALVRGGRACVPFLLTDEDLAEIGRIRTAGMGTPVTAFARSISGGLWEPFDARHGFARLTPEEAFVMRQEGWKGGTMSRILLHAVRAGDPGARRFVTDFGLLLRRSPEASVSASCDPIDAEHWLSEHRPDLGIPSPFTPVLEMISTDRAAEFS